MPPLDVRNPRLIIWPPDRYFLDHEVEERRELAEKQVRYNATTRRVHHNGTQMTEKQEIKAKFNGNLAELAVAQLFDQEPRQEWKKTSPYDLLVDELGRVDVKNRQWPTRLLLVTDSQAAKGGKDCYVSTRILRNKGAYRVLIGGVISVARFEMIKDPWPGNEGWSGVSWLSLEDLRNVTNLPKSKTQGSFSIRSRA